MNLLKVGIIGCGHLGTIHSKLLKNITGEQKNIIFKGVYDIDSKAGEKIATEYGVANYHSSDELFNNINSLIIATPTSTHYIIANEAIEKECHLFIEKPVTEKYFEAEKLLLKAQAENIKVQVGHVERFNPALLSIEKYNLNPKFIESHRLAQFNIRGTDVSVIHDLMIHDIDIILDIVKSPVISIEANGVNVVSDSIDIANARINFQNGCTANITASRISLKKMRKMRLFQPNCYISIDFLENKAEVYKLLEKQSDDKSSALFKITENKFLSVEHPPIKNNINPIGEELMSFFESLLNNKKTAVSLEDASKAVLIAETIIEKIREKLPDVN